jgi:hypothetical protein
MALREGIHCHGIFYDKTAKKFCAITDLPPESEYSKKHYLFLTGSSAAEFVVYGDEDEAGARSDRLAFQNVGAPALKDTVDEARRLMKESESELNRLRSELKARCLKANLNVAALPEVGMAGSDHRFAVLLTSEELKNAVRR